MVGRKINIHKPSGLRYMIDNLRSNKNVGYTLIVIYVNVGFIHEKDKDQGLAHFCEHLMFGGTCDKKKVSDKNQESDDITLDELLKKASKYDCIESYNDILSKISILNASLNAYTTKTHTGYHIIIPSKYVNIAFNLLFDMLHNTDITIDKINKEKNIVIEEEKRMGGNIHSVLNLKLYEMVFKNHPLGKNMLKNIKIINSYDTKLINNFIKTHYTSNNMHISICSDLPTKIIKQKLYYYINKYEITKTKNSDPSYFTDKLNKEIEDKKDILKLAPKPKIYIDSDKNSENCKIQIGFRIPFGIEHKDIFIVEILNQIVGGLSGNRLFTKLRDKNSWVYRVSSDINLYRFLGIFEIETSCDIKNLYKVVSCITKILNDIKTNGITSRELATAKNKMLFYYTNIKNETYYGIAEHNGEMMMYYDKNIPSDTDIKNTIKNMTKDDVLRMAKIVFDIENISISVSGDANKKKLLSAIDQ
jgi:predicted Zn-dependent peptidase